MTPEQLRAMQAPIKARFREDPATAQTVMVEKKGKITYRARFTGFDESTAVVACKAIKKKKTPCQPQGPS